MQNLKTNLENTLTEILEEHLFPVDIQISGEGRMTVKIWLDGDNGVTIDECAVISRKLGTIIEEQELIDGPYVLEVSSPGVGEPLKLLRQYRKNINRFLELQLIENEGKVISGKLVEVGENSIQILKEIAKKGKNKAKKNTLETEPTEILLTQIQRAVVKVMF